MNENNKITEIYISVDVEADGPIPGTYSMVSIGASVPGWRNTDNSYHLTTPEDGIDSTFYAELKPISDRWVPSALAVGKLEGFIETDDPNGVKKRAYLQEHGQIPALAMEAFNEWVDKLIAVTGCRNVVFMGFPAGYDWMFTYWYLINFTGHSPFGHSRMLDLKTFYAAVSGRRINQSVKARMPKKLFPKLPHTHRADEDALEQGLLGMNMLTWDGKS